MAYAGHIMPTLLGHAVTMPEIDRASPVPAWKQIAAHLRSGVSDGTYPPETPLPSIVRICQEYGVARRTANKALAQMAREGLARNEPGMGYWVTPGHPEGT